MCKSLCQENIAGFFDPMNFRDVTIPNITIFKDFSNWNKHTLTTLDRRQSRTIFHFQKNR